MELCNLCKELDLSPLLPASGETGERRNVEWSRLKFARVDYILVNATTCPFCRLIRWVLLDMLFERVVYERDTDEDDGDVSDNGLSKASSADSDAASDEDGDVTTLRQLVMALIAGRDLSSSDQQLRDLAPRFTVSVHLHQKPALGGGFIRQIDLTVEGPHDIIQLPSMITLQDNPPYSCGYARRVDPEQVDYQKLRQWVRMCEDYHQGCKPPVTWTQPRAQASDMGGVHPFMVIDVIEKRVITAPQKCRYAALSYVWGPVEIQFQVKQANLAAVSTDFGLAGFENALPETIKDAMQLVHKIGERYLWVDNMCIVQDDEISKNYWIHEMAAIYAGSILTIVAAAGIDSSAGLPGVRRGTRLYPQISEEVKPGLTLTALNSRISAVDDSKYSSRGWTFQERFLSTRNLVFLPNEAFFECRQAVFIEEITCEDAAFSYEEHDQLYDLAVDSPFQKLAEGSDNYNELVEMYSERCLSHESDALIAFAGMLRVLSLETGSQFLCGHPTNDFDESLLWVSDIDDTEGGTRRKGFPSWAWSGWKGSKMMSILPLMRMSMDSDSDGSETLDAEEEENVRSFIWWRAEIRDTCYQISPPTHSLQDALQGCFDGEQLSVWVQPDFSHLPHLPEYSDTLQQVRLRFWTVVAPFRLSREGIPTICASDSEYDSVETSSVSSVAPRFYSIWGKDDTFCGEVVDCCADGLLTGDSGVHNLVVLRYYARIIIAMIVKWDAGVAERIGLAELPQGALNDALEPGIEWKEIVLG